MLKTSSNVEIEYKGIRKNKKYNDIIEKATSTCFEIESLTDKNLTINVILTTPQEIKNINSEYRKINKETDVLSFPMFNKDELRNIQKHGNGVPEVLGDIVISIEQVKRQGIEYGHGFERELAYMIVHGFYHCMGYDHMEESDKKKMRKKEEAALEKIGLERKL